MVFTYDLPFLLCKERLKIKIKIKIFFPLSMSEILQTLPLCQILHILVQTLLVLGHFAFPEPKYITFTVTLSAVIAVFRFSSVHVW